MSYDRIAKRAYTPDRKAEIMALADRVGVPEAAKQLRVLASTIRRWRMERKGRQSASAQHAP